ncbi:hypothetical protein [Hydrogenophaga sp.]|uniref:hypothetical protein n=1 Tax=Hydrogenophaga sp. TaxID=1904254 RepID=UPI003D0EBE2A
MEPIFGFLLFFAACAVVWIVASKRGRAGWVFALACLVGGVVLAMVIGQIGGSVAAGFGAFLAPVIGLVVAMSASNSQQIAIATGEHGEFRKCPFCAESVRKEAIKCKHCGSELPAVPAS